MVSSTIESFTVRPGPIGLGTVKLGRNSHVKYPKGFTLPTDAEVEALLNHAISAGVNLFDTAPAYGESEKRLSPFVKAHRHEIFLSTKCGEGFEHGAPYWNFERRFLEKQIDQSLKRLGTDHVDLLLLHASDDEEGVLMETDAVATLLDAKAKGQARTVGMSAKTDIGIRGAIDVFDAVMAPINLADQSLAPALEFAHNAGLFVLAIKSLQQGRSLDPAMSISWVVKRDFVDVTVVGTVNPNHLGAAVRAAVGS